MGLPWMNSEENTLIVEYYINPMDREELTAYLLTTYTAELAALKDQELLQAFQIQKAMEQLTNEEWLELAQKVR